MILKKFCPQWAWIVTQWLIESKKKESIRIGMNDQELDPLTFRHMCNDPCNRFYLIFEEEQRQPVGIVALSEINIHSKTARLWYVMASVNPVDIKYLSEAMHQMAVIAFNELGLESIYAWTLNTDAISKQVLVNNRFNFIGRRRQCHPIDGKLYDRLLYDIIAEDFLESAFDNSKPRFLPYHERSSLQNLNH